MKKFDIDNISRLAGLIVEQNSELASQGEVGYKKAKRKLKNFRLYIDCSNQINHSTALQAALITAINTGKRAFQGGVFIKINKETPLLLEWPGKNIYLENLVNIMGGKIIEKVDIDYERAFILTIGKEAYRDRSLQIVCNGWQGGVVPCGETANIDLSSEFNLAGIMAGSLGVALGFLKVSGEKIDIDSKSVGFSLWRPDLDWLDAEANGPSEIYYPQKYWLVGLGHLGQAYCWTLGLLPISNTSNVNVTLQDYDIVSISNWETGLLTNFKNVGSKKTRICSNWLEKRGFSTKIIEHKFSSNYPVNSEDPQILLGGLDSIEVRKSVDINKFKLYIDCGIGGTRKSFDSISIYTFPNIGLNPNEIWKSDKKQQTNNPFTKIMMEKILGCGEFEKGITTSFIGAFASTFVLSEAIRSMNEGKKIKNANLSLRDSSNFFNPSINYTIELIQNGYVS